MTKLNVLVIDDDVDFTNTLRLTFKSWGHDVTVTHNWLAMMRKLNEGNFDVIVADVETPTGNGLTALGFLCEDETVRQIPKAFVTGLNDEATVRRCRDLDAKYVHKSPTVYEDLKQFFQTLPNTQKTCPA